MTIHERAGANTRPSHRRRRMTTLIIVSLVATLFGAPVASAAPTEITDAVFEWGFSAELQHAPPFGGCNFLTAGASDGTQATYKTSEGNVAIVKNNAAPTWATKCDGATTGAMNQKVVWSGGTGTVDPATGEATLSFTGQVSISFYGGLVPFTIEDPVLTVDADGNGQLVATIFGWASSMEDPMVKVPLDPEDGVVVADLSDVTIGPDGITVVPDYEGVQYDPPAGSGGTPQNRTTTGWGSWPTDFVDYHYLTGLTSYWYHSGGAADPNKAPSAITFSFDAGGEEPEPEPEPGEDEQVITVVVPETTDPGEFLWSIDGDHTVDLGETVNQGTYLQATGSITPISVTDTRTGGPEWSVSGQVADFTGGLSGRYLGWSPQVVSAGAGAVAGGVVASGIVSGDGLTVPSILAAAPSGHASGTATLGAGLDLRLPVDTLPGEYSTVLTITALG